MKLHMILAVWLLVGAMSDCLFAGAQTNQAEATVENLVVRKFDKILPEKENDIQKFLWNNFSEKPEEKIFDHATDQDWQKKFRSFEKALVKKAKVASLDAKSLMQCLDVVYDDKTFNPPRIPVGAYATTQKGQAVWIIVIKWEAASSSGKPQELVHIRILAYDAKTQKLLGEAICG